VNCQLYDGITVNGFRPDCRGPAIARITHHHGETTRLCQEHLDAWFDNADEDESLEPVAWRWL
jgi:hypothetical protein